MTTPDGFTRSSDKHYHGVMGGHEVKYPRVTSILDRFYGDWKRYVNPETMENNRQFGNHVHAACELLDAWTLNLNTLDANLKPCVSAWEKFKDEKKVEIWHSEIIVYSKRFRYAGRLDRTGLVDGVPSVIDIKTGPYQRQYDLQAAAYMAAYNEITKGPKLKKRYIVSLGMDENYQVHQCTDKHDIDVFRCMTMIYNADR